MGLAAACNYLGNIGVDDIKGYCSALCEMLYDGLSAIDNVKLITPRQDDYPGIIAFSINGIESHGVARILSNRYAIMVRSGYHCAQPFHELSDIGETVRASVHLYNTQEEVEAFVEAVRSIAGSLSR